MTTKVSKEEVLKSMEIYDMVKHFDKPTIMATVGTILDKWAADNDFTIEEADEMFETLAKVGVVKHSVVGLPQKSCGVSIETIRKVLK